MSSNVASAWGLGTTAMLAPAFAPDGKSLIFIDGDTSAGASWRQGLSLWSFDQAQSKFSGRTNVVSTVASNLVIRWPTVESDSRSVIYQTNPTSSDDTSYGGMLPSAYGNIPGRLWSVDAKDPVNHPPVALDTINTGLGGWEVNRSYQPTVLPTAIGGYRWAVFTSTRAYGNTLNSAAPNTTQLWVAALDDTTSATTDRSHPPFWLPNQTAGDDSARIRNERAYWVLDACHPSIAGGPAPAPAPAPTVTWSDQDIGNVGAAGSATSSAGTTTVKASGDDIWNNADAFHYVSTPVTGDIRIVARINGLSWTSSWAKAGVMIRDARTSGASHAFMMVTAAGTSGLEWRSTTSASSAWTSGLNVGLPYWVRVTRVGTTITGDVSSDGVTWFNVGTSTPTIGTNAYIGLAATAQNNGALTTAVFDNVSVTVPSTDTRVAATCQDDADCCGAQSSPKTSACTVDTPVTNPPTRHCITLSKQSCTALGGACASDSECCSFPNNRCNAGVCSPPPPVSYYPSVTYTRDYTAVCARGLWPVWRFFDWEDVTPGDSSIAFSAAVATTAAGLDSATALPIGTASGATNLTWIGVDVGTKLASVAPPLGRGPSYLRITMAFNPTSDHLQSPLLTAWRQSYSCVPSE